jgi:hypothetical protein
MINGVIKRKRTLSQPIDALMGWRRPPHRVLLADPITLGFQRLDGRVHVDRLPQDHDVDDQSEGAELVLLTFAVALPSCPPFAGKDHTGQASVR